MLIMSARPEPLPPFTHSPCPRPPADTNHRGDSTMRNRLFLRRLCSALSLVLLASGGVCLVTLASAKQDPASPTRRESPEAAGDLDTTFGNGGMKTTDFFGDYDAATSLALQADGKIVLAGIAYHGSAVSSSDFAVARYNLDGNLDPGFGTGGKQTLDFFGNYDQANGVAIQTDGKIVVAGAGGHSISTSDFELARYNPDGSLDPTFGS